MTTCARSGRCSRHRGPMGSSVRPARRRRELTSAFAAFCGQLTFLGQGRRRFVPSVEDVDPLEHARGICEVDRDATCAPALARAAQQRGTHVVLDSGQHRAVGHARYANRNPRRDEMDRRVEPHPLARRAQFDGQPARAEQASHFGGEVGIAARGVVNNDLGVRASVDPGRLPGRVSFPKSPSAILPAWG
jgi:hypothetical protein